MNVTEIKTAMGEAVAKEMNEYAAKRQEREEKSRREAEGALGYDGVSPEEQISFRNATHRRMEEIAAKATRHPSVGTWRTSSGICSSAWPNWRSR